MVNLRLKYVCSGCNNGWMSRLEDDLKPTLAAMMSGNGVVLSQSKQRLLLQYLTMKTMVLDQLAGNPILTAGENRRFYEDRNTPEIFQTYLFQCFEGPIRCAFQSTFARVIREYKFVGLHMPPNLKVFLLGLGDLAILTVIERDAGISLNQRGEFVRLPYVKGLDVHWPPPFPVTSQRLAELFDGASPHRLPGVTILDKPSAGKAA